MHTLNLYLILYVPSISITLYHVVLNDKLIVIDTKSNS